MRLLPIPGRFLAASRVAQTRQEFSRAVPIDLEQH